MRRFSIMMLLAMLGLAVFAAAGDAYTVTRTQNPQFRVTVTISPRHPEIGDRVVATVKIVNRTERSHRVEYEVAWETPSHGISAAQVTVVKPGVITSATYHAWIRPSTPSGTFRIFGAVSDKHGRTFAAAHVFYASG
jgi:hypothetical protein